MTYQRIERERRGEAGWIWMNRPETHNAFDDVMIAELDQAFADFEADETIRVIVLGGRGRSFSAGADLRWMERAAGQTVDQNLKETRAMAAMFRRIDACSKPTLARVQGAAVGGGVGLTSACDIAIAASTAWFATTEVRHGLIAATISPYVVGAIGARAARRYFLTAERFTAEQAQRLGLVHEVCAPEDLDSRVEEMIRVTVANGPRAQAASKDLIRRLRSPAITPELIEETAQAIAGLRTTAEAREGFRAFVERRNPSWTR